jgi:hypothetical protein
MRVLLDEGLPVQLLSPLRRNLGHEFAHVDDLLWKSKEDPFLFRDAASRGFEAIVVLDLDQLVDPSEWQALRDAGLHHVSVRQGRRVQGKKGLARVMGSLIVAMPYVLEDLDAVDSQRIVEIALLAAGPRHDTFDPKRERRRYPYWR